MGEWCSFFDWVQVFLFRTDGNNRSLICVQFSYLVLKALCWTDVGERIEMIQAQMFEGLISAYIYIYLSKYTQSHNSSSSSPSLLTAAPSSSSFSFSTDLLPGAGDVVVGWMRSGSSISFSLFLSLPPSLTSFISLSRSLCSAALQTLQTQSSQQAPLSALGLLVYEYANTACVCVCACVWILSEWVLNFETCENVTAWLCTYNAVFVAVACKQGICLKCVFMLFFRRVCPEILVCHGEKTTSDKSLRTSSCISHFDTHRWC